ncbi:MAG: lytic transglycosylase domain-containing protein [Pseudomonadota bacterium]
MTGKSVYLLTSAAWLLLIPVSLGAQDAPPFENFSAKRVTPPKPGVGKRITVQIDPAEVAARLERERTRRDAQARARAAEREAEETTPAPDGEAPSTASPGRYSWFWDQVSPQIGGTGTARLEAAMLALATGETTVPTPRMQSMQNLAQAHGVDILKSTVGTSVSPALVLAVMMVESAGQVTAESPVGAQGLMQLMPATAERFGVTDRLEPAQSISGGVKYLSWLMREFGGDPLMVLAGYNAGEGAVKKYQGVPPFAETRDYVPKVLAAFQVARGLCLTPPELISDGCVFAALN